MNKLASIMCFTLSFLSSTLVLNLLSSQTNIDFSSITCPMAVFFFSQSAMLCCNMFGGHEWICWVWNLLSNYCFIEVWIIRLAADIAHDLQIMWITNDTVDKGPHTHTPSHTQLSLISATFVQFYCLLYLVKDVNDMKLWNGLKLGLVFLLETEKLMLW